MTAIDQAFIKAYTDPAVLHGRSFLPERPVTPSAEAAADPKSAGDAGTIEKPEVKSASTVAASTLPGPPKFQPAYQVDSFAWPSGCTRLSMVASDQVERLADALVAGLEQGRQVIAMSGCRRGDGCTTLLLCAARRLADRGLRIAIVDADFDNPLLARRLGLLPESGWEEVFAARLPAEEVTIESVQDRLAVLPLCGALPSRGGSNRATGLDVLRETYDLVLVDLGEFDEGIGDGPSQTMVGWIDAVVLVHNVRSTSGDELSRMRRRATATGFVEAGIVENFAEARRSA